MIFLGSFSSLRLYKKQTADYRWDSGGPQLATTRLRGASVLQLPRFFRRLPSDEYAGIIQ